VLERNSNLLSGAQGALLGQIEARLELRRAFKVTTTTTIATTTSRFCEKAVAYNPDLIKCIHLLMKISSLV
jgi:hypothetical protein